MKTRKMFEKETIAQLKEFGSLDIKHAIISVQILEVLLDIRDLLSDKQKEV